MSGRTHTLGQGRVFLRRRLAEGGSFHADDLDPGMALAQDTGSLVTDARCAAEQEAAVPALGSPGAHGRHEVGPRHPPGQRPALAA
jgi:hypothetical protein